LPVDVEVDATHAGPESAVSVALLKPAEVVVLVRDERGLPLADVDVELELVPEPASVRRARTDTLGTCHLEAVAPCVPLRVSVRRPPVPRQLQELTLAPDEERTLEFVFGQGCRIDGVVVDEAERPLAGLDLWRLAGEETPAFLTKEHEAAVVDKARTDRDGRFAFQGVPSGPWSIGAAPYAWRGPGTAPLTEHLWIAAEERARTLKLVAPSSLFLRGRVLDQHEKPAHARVRATNGDVSFEEPTGVNGEFVLGPLAEGSWTLAAEALALSVGLDPRPEAAASSGERRVQAGQSDLVLRLRHALTLHGRVLDAGGHPAARAEVEVACENEEEPHVTRGDADGFFRLGGLPDGRCRLLARSGTQAAERILALTPGQASGVEVRLRRAASLRLRPPEAPAGSGTFRVLRDDLVIATGRLAPADAVVLVLPGGPARCEFRSARSTETRDVVLNDGETAEIVFGGAGAPR
jgi:hypothetical protein